MLSVQYSLNTTTFDPKGKILQVSHPNIVLFSAFVSLIMRIIIDWLCKRGCQARIYLPRAQVR